MIVLDKWHIIKNDDIIKWRQMMTSSSDVKWWRYKVTSISASMIFTCCRLSRDKHSGSITIDWSSLSKTEAINKIKIKACKIKSTRRPPSQKNQSVRKCWDEREKRPNWGQRGDRRRCRISTRKTSEKPETPTNGETAKETRSQRVNVDYHYVYCKYIHECKWWYNPSAPLAAKSYMVLTSLSLALIQSRFPLKVQ